MSRKARVAVVGMGIGMCHARALLTSPRAELVALCDAQPQRLDDAEKKLERSVKRYTDFAALCRDRDVDAVFIGTPNQLHVPMALQAIKYDKHVLITKPLADSERAAAKLVKVAEAAGVVNMMSLSTRFSDGCRYLRRQAERGLFGELYYGRARSIRRSGIPNWNLGFIQRGGGAFRDMGVHVLDAAWWLLGTPLPVSVTGVAGAKFGPRGEGYWDFKPVPRSFSRKYDSDDYGGGFIRFEGGIGLQVESFWASHQLNEFNIELFGTDAGARLKPLTVYQTKRHKPVDKEITLPKAKRDVWRVIVDHFADCILDGTPCSAPLRHGWQVQRMMEGLLKSAQTGREVRL